MNDDQGEDGLFDIKQSDSDQDEQIVKKKLEPVEEAKQTLDDAAKKDGPPKED